MVPFASVDQAALLAEQGASLLPLHNGFCARTRSTSPAPRVHHGDAMKLTPRLGTFDVSVMTAVLQHLHDPVAVVTSCAARTRDTIVITDLDGTASSGRDIDAPVSSCFLPPTARRRSPGGCSARASSRCSSASSASATWSPRTTTTSTCTRAGRSPRSPSWAAVRAEFGSGTRNKVDTDIVNFGMPLDPNKFTRKTGEALGAAQSLARERNHSQVTPEHLLAALLGQPESVVLPVLERLGVSTKTRARPGRRRRSARLPQVYGADRAAGAALARRVPGARGGRRASAPTSATTTSRPSTCCSR